MRAIVTKEFKGLADGTASERYFVEGEVVYGDLAALAVAEGNAKEEKTAAAPAAPAAPKPRKSRKSK